MFSLPTFPTLRTGFGFCSPRCLSPVILQSWSGGGRSMAAIGISRLNSKWRAGCARRYSNTSTRLRRKSTSKRSQRPDLSNWPVPLAVRSGPMLSIPCSVFSSCADCDSPNQIAFLLKPDRNRQETLDDGGIGCGMKGRFRRSEGASACQGHRHQ